MELISFEHVEEVVEGRSEGQLSWSSSRDRGRGLGNGKRSTSPLSLTPTVPF